MNPGVNNVIPKENYLLILEFTNGQKKIFDMKPWLDKEIFSPLKNISIFNNVNVMYGSISWNDEIDICPDTLYLESREINEMQ